MFFDRLTTKLSLTIGGTTFAFVAGAIEQFSVDVFPWGVFADVVFFVSSEQEPDTLFEPFSGTDLVLATFSLSRETQGEDDGSAMKVIGYATTKSVVEVVGAGLKGAPVIGRRYVLHVEDLARAFWTRHRPLELYAQASMEDMLDANKPMGMDLTYDWGILSQTRDVLCVGLDGEASPSFYDFMMWFVDRNQGVFELDARTGKYRLGAKKAKGAAATALDPEDVEQIRLLFPDPPRFAGRVLNPFADAPSTKTLANSLAASGVRRDVIVRTPIAAEAEQRAQVETGRFRARPLGIEITYLRCPESVPMAGDLLSVGEGFSEKILPSGRTYRVVRLRASGTQKKEGQTVELDSAAVVYEIGLVVEGEDQGSLVAWLPPFEDPRQTMRVEGKIVSSGAAGQRTWAAVENDSNSLWTYKVNIPVFNKVIPAPFDPSFISGHFFFPAFKDQRVLVDIDFDRALISGMLDWADEARLPSDSQGNQIALGPKAANGTVIRHAYVDATPVLTIERNTINETSTVQLGDGMIRIGLEEKVAPPAALQVFDVSPQVDAAKDQVVGEVGGSVATVTSQFQTSVGQVSDAVDETVAQIDTEISGAERTLVAKLDGLENELQGMAADASAQVASVSMGATKAKSRLLAAVQGVDPIRQPLEALSRRLTAFATTARLEVGALESEIESIATAILSPVDQFAEVASGIEARAKSRFGALREAIETLGPKARPGPFQDLATFRQEVAALARDVDGFPDAVGAKVDNYVRSFVVNLSSLESEVTSLGQATGARVDRSLDAADAKVLSIRATLASKRAASLPPTVAGRITSAEARLDALAATARQTLAPVKADVAAQIANVEGRAKSARVAITNAASSAASAVNAGLTALAQEVDRILSVVDSSAEALESAASTIVSTLASRAAVLEQTVLPPLHAVPEEIATAKSTLQGALTTAEETLRGLLTAVDTLLSNLDSAVQAPLKAAIALIDTAEQTATSTVDTVGQTIDTMVATAQKTLQGFVTAFESLVNGAGTAIGTVRALVASLRAQIMPPIDALQDLVSQLESVFQTGVNLLTGFLSSAHAALDAIPAVALPKALIEPTTTAIQAALSAVLPLITAGAAAAGTQVSTLATTLVSQIQTAESAAVTAVSTFVTTIDQQLDTLLPPIRTQIAAVEQQIDNAIEEFLTQLDAATTTAVNAIQSIFDAAATQAQTVEAAAASAISAAETQLTTVAAEVRTQIDTQTKALTAQTDALVAALRTKVDEVEKNLDAGAALIETGITTARTELQKQLETALATVRPGLVAARTALAKIPPELDTQLARLADQHKALVASVKALVPQQATVEAAIDSAAAPVLAALDALNQEVAAL